ncbi:SDR family NAD(P)-dependent oxidoreductase [Singulisphaera acidiphila]|uniref:SDR family NAD(P)-dependent oxidoreductase n=1 Tax=Singulisphaera acidiphila TaxID=466153 RepID=UPI0036F34ADB
MVNPFDLTGKVAIVTGGNGGLGLGIARGLAEAGAKLAIVARNSEKTESAARDLAEATGVEVLALTADVSQPEPVALAVAAVIERFGRIDILFNNAGTTIRKPPHLLSLDEWHTVMDVNLTSAFLMSKEVYPSLKAAGGGKVVNIGSMASIFGASYAPAYAASKGGIVQLTKSCALAWASDNIQVNAILPGWFVTDMTDRARVEVAGLNERVLARVPAGRWAEPRDIAGTAVWLSSAASDFVTGASVPVDGGYSSIM